MIPIFSAIVAGLLTSLSPCVIAALPFVVSSSFSHGKRGPLLIVAGLILSFVILGVTFALTTKVVGIDQDLLKNIAAILFLLIGIVLLVPKAAAASSRLFSGLANTSNSFADKTAQYGLLGQFILGLLLGLVWSPCSGPSLGYALTLVAQKGEITYGAFIMLVYGLSASTPLLFIAYFSRNFVQKNMSNIDKFQSIIKKIMGGFLIVFAILTLTGNDKRVEALLINLMPEAMFDLITKH